MYTKICITCAALEQLFNAISTHYTIWYYSNNGSLGNLESTQIKLL